MTTPSDDGNSERERERATGDKKGKKGEERAGKGAYEGETNDDEAASTPCNLKSELSTSCV